MRLGSIFFMSALANGVIAPVLTFLFLSRGASMVTLSLFIGIYMLTVVVSEVPSGIAADVFGRKTMFILAHLFLMCSYTVLLLGSGNIFLALACILMGLGRASASGSLEALVIEQGIAAGGVAAIPRINGQIAVIDSIALAIGALSGGLLGWGDGSYRLVLVVLVVCELSTLILSLLWVTEERRNIKWSWENWRYQFYSMGRLMRNRKIIQQLLFMSILLGISLTVVETYWQSSLANLLQGQLGWGFGAVSCLGYLGVSLGNVIAGYLLICAKDRAGRGMYFLTYIIARWMLPLALIFMGTRESWQLFALAFGALYFVTGVGNYYENILFHLYVENENRAGMLSVASLCIRGGGAVTGLLGSFLMYRGGLRAVWLWLPLLVIVLTVGCTVIFIPRKPLHPF